MFCTCVAVEAPEFMAWLFWGPKSALLDTAHVRH